MADKTKKNPERATPSLLSNWLSMLGVFLAGLSFFSAACLIAIDYFRGFKSPYMGILTYMVAPAFLVAGLVLILLGALWERRRRRRLKPGEIPSYPRIDFNLAHHRRRFAVVSMVLFAFILLSALGSYRTYQFTESVGFCGKTCHAIMQPEYTAYHESPHARVDCVECHIGPGATWFVKSKLSGVYQVYATLMDKYPRPIPAPIRNLRPAQETCEQCHWPRKFYGASERMLRHYLSDKENSPWTIWMLIKTGGGDPSFGEVGGIHWHMNIAKKVEYIHTDEKRQAIPWVRITDQEGEATLYQSVHDPLTPEQIAAARPRRMDCIDCHNRPTHIYNSPVRSVDLALSTGRISRTIPYIKQQAVTALAKEYETADEAERSIAEALRSFCQSEYPSFAKANPELIEQAIQEVQYIYAHNFFPDMKVNWRTYNDNIGHKTYVGCYRCHDGNHVSEDGKEITRECNSCHTIIAQGPGETPGPITSTGLEFKHPVDIDEAWKEMQCTECHDGALVE